MSDQLEAFVTEIGQTLTGVAAYQYHPTTGHEWRWSTSAGVWGLFAGGSIDAGPVLLGPTTGGPRHPGENRWHLDAYSLQHADLVILMLRLAGALPPPPPAQGGHVRPVPAPILARAAEQMQHAVPVVAGSDLPARAAHGPGSAYIPTQAPGPAETAARLNTALYGERQLPPAWRPSGAVQHYLDGQRGTAPPVD